MIASCCRTHPDGLSGSRARQLPMATLRVPQGNRIDSTPKSGAFACTCHRLRHRFAPRRPSCHVLGHFSPGIVDCCPKAPLNASRFCPAFEPVGSQLAWFLPAFRETYPKVSFQLVCRLRQVESESPKRSALWSAAHGSCVYGKGLGFDVFPSFPLVPHPSKVFPPRQLPPSACVSK